MSNIIDIKTRKPYETPPTSEQSTMQFFDLAKAKAAETGVTTILLLTVTYDRHVDFKVHGDDENLLCLAHTGIDDLEEELLAKIYKDTPVDDAADDEELGD